jgi:hypothetical protein
VEAVRELVQLVETGGHTGHALAAVAGRLNFVHRGLHDVLEHHVILGSAPLSHGINLGLGLVDQVLHLAVRAVAQLHDLGAGIHQAPKDRAFSNDLGVIPGVGCGGYGLDQLMQVRRAADPVDLGALGELVGDRDSVSRFAAAVEVDDGFIDGFMRRPVEVLAAEDLHDVGNGVFGQHHAAQDGLFGGNVLGRLPAHVRPAGGLDRVQMRY